VKVAIYARVSTADQNCERQLTELREYCQRRNWPIAGEYVDTGWSGAKASRPQLDACMKDAKHHKFDVVMVWSLDRWGRSVSHLVKSIEELSGYGVGWMSYTQNLDTSDGNPMGKLILTIIGAIAEFERAMIRERVNSGLTSYRKAFTEGRIGKQRQSKSGKNLAVGRPQRVFRRDEARKLRKSGMSFRAIAKALAVPLATIQRALK